MPIVVYDNANVDKIRILMPENKGKSGIYRRVNINNGKSYVGSSVHLKIDLSATLNHLYINYDMLICRALIKYDYSNFRLEILEYCTLEDIVARENYYINLLNLSII